MSADGFTIDGLAQALNMSRERVENAISDLVRMGLIERASEGRWRPTEAGWSCDFQGPVTKGAKTMSTEQNLLRGDVEMHVQNVLMDIVAIYAELRDELDKIGIDGKTLMEWEGGPGLVHTLEAELEGMSQAWRDELVQRRKEMKQ